MAKKNICFAELTLNLRHKCVRLLAPKLWQSIGELTGEDSIKFDRPMISFLKQHFKDKKLVGCEIGVREGVNSLRIMQTLNVEKLYLVDPYLPYTEPLFAETMNPTYHFKMREEAKARLAPFKDKLVWLNVTSNRAISFVKGLDFCYIDGDHSEEQVKRDLRNYGKLIKSGGVIGGHDFTTSYIGLCKAVLDFKEQNPEWISLDGNGFDWWMVKA